MRRITRTVDVTYVNPTQSFIIIRLRTYFVSTNHNYMENNQLIFLDILFSHIALKIRVPVFRENILTRKAIITGGALGLQGAGQGGQTPHCNNIINEHRTRLTRAARAHKGRRQTLHTATYAIVVAMTYLLYFITEWADRWKKSFVTIENSHAVMWSLPVLKGKGAGNTQAHGTCQLCLGAIGAGAVSLASIVF